MTARHTDGARADAAQQTPSAHRNDDALFAALRAGKATAEQQARAFGELCRLREELSALRADAERGRYVVEYGEWLRHEDAQDGRRTWIRIRVADDANLSCKALRAAALDAVRSKVV